MPLDIDWLNACRATDDLATRDTMEIDGVEIVLPVANARGKQRHRDWQRRVLADIMPDSVNADAPERTPFRLLYALTTGQATKTSIDEALAGELAPLEDVFRAVTRGKKKMTLAFHVLAVKAAGKGESDAKGFTERTLLLLSRKDDGTVDEPLLRDLIDQFRRAPAELDLAQRTLLDRLYPDWKPSDEPTFNLPDSARMQAVPFDRSASRLFREDIRNLLAAGLPPADFFQQLNLLLMMHLGLYQPRVASYLNPQMDLLFREMASPNADHLAELDAMLEHFEDRHPFYESLSCRAPDPGHRPVTLQSPERVAFDKLITTLAVFHFNLLVLSQLRRLSSEYLVHRWGIADDYRRGRLSEDTAIELARQVRGPRELVSRMQGDPDFARFLDRALTALCVRFIDHQIADLDREAAMAELARAESGLHGLRQLYKRYNIQTSRDKTSSRAYRQGISITSSLLRQGQYGLLQGRQRVGPFFEAGAGLLPLLILLVVGAGREKIPVSQMWDRLAQYGLSFDRAERETMLGRLRAMGVYERYSDAGEAAYVRNLMTEGGLV